MPKKDLTLTSKIILGLHLLEDMAIPLVSFRDLQRRLYFQGDYDSFRAIFYRLEKRGLLKFIKHKKDRFIKLTEKGHLEALLSKAKPKQDISWDGKWRLVIFDIPEEAREHRERLRQLLKINHFVKLQASVFVCPYPLNREALDYLKKSKLIEYIRIMRVDEMDCDKDLKKRFGLK